MPEQDEARLLDIPDALPVLELARGGTSTRGGKTIEVTVCVIPADRAEIVTSLRRAPTARWPVEPIVPH